jgi:aspartate/methionine/tyrosine aminotransferase
MRAQNHSILDLTESNPTQVGLQYDRKKILSAFQNQDHLTYSPDSRGKLKAREAISKLYYQKRGLNVTSEQIILTASTSEAYSFLFRLLTNPNDAVLSASPSYPLLEHLTRLNDIELTSYQLQFHNAWAIDWDSLEQNIRSHHRALVLIHPNNPTGSFMKRAEMVRLNAFCKIHGLVLICDEVFLDYAFENDDARVPSFSENSDVLTFTLSGLSKTLALPQMKLSWIVLSGPRRQTEESMKRLEFISDAFLSVNTPVQEALEIFFETQDHIQNQIRQRCYDNYLRLSQALHNSSALSLLPSEGGWYGIFRLSTHVDEEKFVLRLLKEQGVLIHPGYFYDLEGSHGIVSLLCEPKKFQQGLSKLLDISAKS